MDKTKDKREKGTRKRNKQIKKKEERKNRK